ncbi:uncharacterized protein K452DRAFT_246864 [Aplosporella prunicola CBS 121167]|uniref:RNA polymerase I-specific transcription initiation factor RRN6-like protein n=1 Tax=Aplosporella prunicola CBS 121167 TaxID=1176127 RepID=A0A6A6BHZ2_9PEZI|nr:uncharacterized protein K452DRAFT_246864 [Aplosporella prunicola CBS 121167]KAF2143616.1 hypothetical protein K452DRAFT_246864 [Aplosporella prunicola CBS 121167]
MTDPSVDDLHYGHVGHALYDQENRQWLFNRQPGRRRILRPLGDIESSGVEAASADPLETVGNASTLDEQKKRLLAANPELRAAEAFVTRDAQISETLTAVVAKYDALRGDLLAFGRAADVDNRGSKGTIRVAAIPGGTAGQSLRLVQERFEKQGWGEDKSVWLNVPSLGLGETGWWSGNGAPIQQLCFANQPDERGTFLAVRTAKSVHIFRPRFRRVSVAALKDPGSHSKLPSSRLEVSPVVSLVLRPGEPTYADVTFNPDYQRQFATITQEGKWAVWDIEGSKQKRFTFKTIQTKSGHLREEGNTARYDGWGRILWAANVNTVVVCNRRLLEIVDFQGHSLRLDASSLRLMRTSSWILDLRRDPQDSSRVLLLTSTHLLVIRIPSLEEDKDEVAHGALILLSWRHFRNNEDITLQLSAMVDNEDTVIFLRSQEDHGVTVFRYTQNSETASLPFSPSDPTVLYLSAVGDDQKPTHSLVRNISFQLLDYGETSRTRVPGPGNGFRDHGVMFYNVYMLLNNLEVNRRLVFLYDPSSDPTNSPWASQPSIEVPSWTKRSMQQSSSRVKHDSFIVADDLIDSDDELTVAPWLRPAKFPRKGSDSADVSHTSSDDSLTVDKSRVCEFLDDPKEYERENVSTLIAESADRLQATPDPEEHHYDTLWQYFGGELAVADIDETEESFANLLRSFGTHEGQEASLLLQQVGSASQLGLPDYEDGKPSFLKIYDTVIKSWLSTLPKAIPPKVRLANSQLAREVAAQLCFASTSIKIQQPEQQQEPQQEPELDLSLIQDADFVSPSKSARKNKGRASQEYFSIPSSQSGSYGSSQPSALLLTPEATPSLVSGSSFSSGMSTLSDGSFARLRQYTTFDRQIPSLPRQMNRLLSHWAPGTDPASYSYEATKAATSQIDAMEEEGMSQKERAKLHRKAEKHLRRQRRETAAHLASQSQSQAMTPLVSHHPRSSPGPASVGPAGSSQFPASSQFTPSQKFPASQPVPGQFSGRPKKKIKRRIEGF